MPKASTTGTIASGAKTSLIGMTRAELARRVALIHAELWIADDAADATRSALAGASDALDELVRDVVDDGMRAELAEARAVASTHVAVAGGPQLREGRALVEDRLSEVLLGILGVSMTSALDVAVA